MAAGLPWHWVVIVACALLVTLPLFRNGPSCGHDFDFHLQSWFAANQDWRLLTSGQAAGSASRQASWSAAPLYPHWVPEANYGAGEPRFVFYPPVSWTLGALIGAVLPWTTVAQVFTWIALAACGLAFYRLARAWFSPTFATGAACVYLANPYLLFVAYERTAYGELLAAIAMPLVVLYTLRERPPVVRLATVVALLWLTNAPAAVMGAYLLAFCALAAAIAERSMRPAARALGALALGTGLASFYVLPAWYEQRWVEITRVVGPGMRVEDSFLFGHTGEAFHDHVLHTASWIAVAVLGTGLVCIAVSWLLLRAGPAASERPERSDRPAERAPLILLYGVTTAGLAAILLLQLPLSEPVWRFAPELRFLQFPWRWLLVGGLLATLAGGTAAASLWQAWHTRRGPLDSRTRPDPTGPRNAGFTPCARRFASAAAVAAVLCAGAGYAGHSAGQHFAQFCDDEDNVLAQQALLAATDSSPAQLSPPGFEGTDEYTPAGADNSEIQQGLPPVRLLAAPDADEGDDSISPNPDWISPSPVSKPGATSAGSVRIEQWGPEDKRITITTPAAAYAVLRLMDYPAWQVLVNGHHTASRPHREDGLLTIPVDPGTQTIEVRWHATPDVYAGRALSLVSLALLIATAARSRQCRLVS